MELERDFVYADENRQDIGALKDYSIDLSYGEEENDFLITLPLKKHTCGRNYILYAENTEYGGIVDETRVNTAENAVSYYGRTFHGILESKVIEPDPGMAYYKVSGEANTIIKRIIQKLNLESIFTASPEDSGVQIVKYQFDRYVKAYTGIKKMLSAAGAKLVLKYTEGMVILSAENVKDYSEESELDTMAVDFDIKKKQNHVNHLICLGSGTLTNRQVIHLYTNDNGDISKTQSIYGSDEYVDIYDYPNTESLEELEKGGTERLRKEWEDGILEISVKNMRPYEIGDIVGGKEWVTGISARQKITQKIVTITNGIIKVEYKTGG